MRPILLKPLVSRLKMVNFRLTVFPSCSEICGLNHRLVTDKMDQTCKVEIAAQVLRWSGVCRVP